MKTARQKHVHLVFQAKCRHVLDVVHVMNRIQNIQNVYVKKDTKVKIVDLFRVL